MAFFSLGQIACFQKDFREAYKWFNHAIEKGHARSKFYLGKLYWRGLGVVQDRKRARRLLSEAARANVAEAQRAERYLSYLGSKQPKM
jgi:TPR repeat protein